jgi:hypothetical protein
MRAFGFLLALGLTASMLLLGCGAPVNSPNAKNSGMDMHSLADQAHSDATSFASNADRPESVSDGVDVTKNPEATFKGCWHTSGKNRYQAVDVSVKNAGKYPFNAVLYYGTGCGVGNFADQFGFGQIIDFGGFGYTFWFTAFANKTDMSALWYVGTDKSQCVNYEVAPNC